jgi:hypothetical protein
MTVAFVSYTYHYHYFSPFPSWAQLPDYVLFRILTPSTLSRHYEFVQQTLTGSELRNCTERKGYFWSLRDVVLAL